MAWTFWQGVKFTFVQRQRFSLERNNDNLAQLDIPHHTHAYMNIYNFTDTLTDSYFEDYW